MPAQPKSSPAKPATKRRTTTSRPKSRSHKPPHDAIAERAYFIHLEEGSSDEVANWLRAERELRAA
jgi:hypothetical protein